MLEKLAGRVLITKHVIERVFEGTKNYHSSSRCQQQVELAVLGVCQVSLVEALA